MEQVKNGMRAEQLAAQATQILRQHQQEVLSKIMADGKIDDKECAEVAANMVAGLRAEDFDPMEISGAILLMCFTVAELAEDVKGIKPGTAAELAKDAFPLALMHYKQAHMQQEQSMPQSSDVDADGDDYGR